MNDIKEELPPISEGARRAIARAEDVMRKKARELDKYKTPLKPSKEVGLFLDREASFLSEKGKKLLEDQAYFYERGIDNLIGSLKNERPLFLMDEDKSEIEMALRWLDSDYIDYLDPDKEYPASKEVIKSLEGSLDIMINHHQPVNVVWHILAERISDFHLNIVLNEARDTIEKQRIFYLNYQLKGYILGRIPDLIDPTFFKKTKQSLFSQKFERVLDSLEAGTFNEETEQRFDEFEDYIDKNLRYEELEVNLSNNLGLEWRNNLIKLVEEKGTLGEAPFEEGRTILLDNERIKEQFGGEKIQIWYPCENYPVHIKVVGLSEGSKPYYVRILQDGEVDSGINYYKNDPESLKRADEARGITTEQWKSFIEAVIKEAQQYTP